MKIKVVKKPYDEVMQIPPQKHFKPVKQSRFLRWLIPIVAKRDLKDCNFTYTTEGMQDLNPKAKCLYLMNHSSFVDLEMAGTILKNKQYHIVTTNDAFIGKVTLLRKVGCIPAKKFISDTTLIKDMHYCFEVLNSSVLMYPEASYSFDGTQTTLPESLGKLIKLMKVPVVMIRTEGAFLREPLYNNLQKRKTTVTCHMKYLLSPEQCDRLSATEINDILDEEFDYDHFREQHENGVTIKEPFRADFLHRVLYKCPYCKEEDSMVGKGSAITCHKCNGSFRLHENGALIKDSSMKQEIPFAEPIYVTDWYKWQRSEVRKEIAEQRYSFDSDVEIMMMVDTKAVYQVGEGHLHHDSKGFVLTGCGGKLNFSLSSSACYSLYSDYFWYELGDMIAIGDQKRQYYCFPKNQDTANVAKVRIATEEIFNQLTRKFGNG